MNNFSILLFSVLFPVTLSGCTTHRNNISYAEIVTEDSSVSFSTSVNESEDAEEIYISIQGEIANPGVYLLPGGSRVYELINLAGGVTDNADTASINMVFILQDGMQIIIPSIQSEEEAYVVSDDLTAKSNTADSKRKLVNINTASIQELTSLTGIGDTRAKAIIAYRDSGGVFKKPEDLMNVTGIKSGIYEALKDEICVE